MSNVAAHWVALQFLDDCAVVLAVNIEGENCVLTCRARDCDTKVTAHHGEGDWVHAMSVEDCWNAIGGAETTGSCATCFAAYFGGESCCIRHG